MLIFLDIIISIVDILSLALLLWIIQFYIQPDQSNKPGFLPGWLADRNSIVFIAVYFIFFGIKNVAAYLVSKAHYKFITRVTVRISRNNLSGYQQAGFDEFVNTDSSVYIRRIGFLPLEFGQNVLAGVPQIITQAVLIVLTIIAIVLFNARLFLLLLAILLPPVIVIFYFIRSRLNKVRKQITIGNEISFRHLLDALKGYVESNIYGRNDFFLNRFVGSRKKFSTSLFNSTSLQTMPARIIEIFAVLGLFLLIAIAKWSGSQDSSYLITIGAFVGAAYKIIPGIVKIINLSGQIKAYGFSLADLTQNNKPITPDKVNATASGIDSIELKNVNFKYDQQPVLTAFSLSIQKGDFIGISGDSGKGKTTILNLLLGFLEPLSGEILINNRSANKEDIRACWPQVAYVKQQSFFIHDTVLRNITLEEENHDPQKLQIALAASGLDKLTREWPEGLEKLIAENGKNISGGQRQRIAIARALYKDAQLIILDEPFSELDEESECLVLQNFRTLSQQGKTILLVTHNANALSACNKLVKL
ncbi:MAG TPA: ABC transporter ATP-binding protein [Chitinophagaceae bacterium]|nr:ABC transporter ATP-binding protein [Chitinophagaceae bacterium]